MTILWDKKLIKLSNGSYISWGLKRKKFSFSNKNELKLNCAIIEYYEEREKCDEKVISDYRKIVAEIEAQIEKMKNCHNCRKFHNLSYDCTCAEVCNEWEIKEK